MTILKQNKNRILLKKVQNTRKYELTKNKIKNKNRNN